MPKRTTIEIDEDLLSRAKRALGTSTTRGTVEEALRLASETTESGAAAHADRQRNYFAHLAERIDIDVLESDAMWR